MVYSQIEDNWYNLQTNKVFKSISIGQLSSADYQCDELIENAIKSKNDYYLKMGYIHKIRIFTSRQKQDSVFYYRQKINPNELHPTLGYYLNIALYEYYMFDGMAELANNYINETIKSEAKITNPRLKALTYSKAIDYYHFNSEESSNNLPITQGYIEKWQKILPDLNEAETFEYYQCIIKLYPLDSEKRNNAFKELKSLAANYDYKLFHYYYYFLSYEYDNPFENAQHDQDLIFLNKAKRYLNMTEMHEHDADLYKGYVDYYEKRKDYTAIINLEDELAKKNELYGKYNLIIPVINAYYKVGLYNNMVNLGTSHLTKFERQNYHVNNYLENNVIVTLQNQKYTLSDTRKERTKQLYAFLILTVIIIAMSAYMAYYLMQKNKNLKALNQRVKDQNSNLEIFVTSATNDLKQFVDIIENINETVSDDNSIEVSKEKNAWIHDLSNQAVSLLAGLVIHNNLRLGVNYDKEQMDFVSLLEAELDSLWIYLKNQSIELSLDLEEGLSCMGNEQLMSQLIKNLIHNAVKFRSEERNSLIKIKSFRNSNGELQLEFWDNGVGFSKKKIKNIFKNSITDKDSKEGGNIALYFSKEIVEYHNATIEVNSVLNEWTCFVLKFPLVDSKEIQLKLETPLKQIV